MRRTWPFLFVVAGLGVGAGAAISGRPTPADPFVINPNDVPTTTTIKTDSGAAERDLAAQVDADEGAA